MVSIIVEMSKCIAPKIKSQKCLFKERFANPQNFSSQDIPATRYVATNN